MATIKVDLHSHSTNSDGMWSVRQILKEAENKKIKYLAISDHDNLNGSIEALKVNNQENIYSGVIIPAIEISTKVNNRTAHLVCYFKDIPDGTKSSLLQDLEKIRNSRVWRMKEMIKKANQMNFNVTFEDVLEEAGKDIDGEEQPIDVLSRPHLARVLLNKNYVKSMDEAFGNYLADGKPLYVARFSLNYDEWIDRTKQENGLIVIAHPLHEVDEDISILKNKINTLVKSGLDGIERIYDYKGKYSVSEKFVQEGNKVLDEIIAENDLLITCGGDFHGDVGKLGELEIEKSFLDKFLHKLGN